MAHMEGLGKAEQRGAVNTTLTAVPSLPRLPARPALLLCAVLHRAARAPGGPGRAPVPEEVRRGLGQVLPARALPHPSLRVLTSWGAHGEPSEPGRCRQVVFCFSPEHDV